MLREKRAVTEQIMGIRNQHAEQIQSESDASESALAQLSAQLEEEHSHMLGREFAPQAQVAYLEVAHL